MDESRRRERLAENERTLRHANERIAAMTASLAEAGFARQNLEADFLCACGRPDCAAIIRLSIDDYAAVHREPHRFIVAPGHEAGEIERVVDERDDYVVVEKLPAYQAEDR